MAHPLGPERERQGEHRRETFGDGGDRDRDGEQQRFVEAVDALDADAGDSEYHGERGDPACDPMPEVLQAALERGAFGLDCAEHRRDATHRRFGPGAGDLDPGQTAHGERAREDVLAGGSLDRHRLAGQDRLVDLQGLLTVQDAVGGNAITGLDPDQIAGNQHRGVELVEVVVAHHPHLRGGEFPQPREGVLGPVLLPHPHDGVEHQDRRDGDRLERPLVGALGDPDDQVERQREQQDVDDRAAQLAADPHPPPHRRRLGERVRAVPVEPLCRLCAGQAAEFRVGAPWSFIAAHP